MIRLSDLASEILGLIVQALSKSFHPVESDADLYNLALTCRVLFQVTEPFLYTKFVQSSHRQVSLFLRTIIEKPTYALRVKTLCLEQRRDDVLETDSVEEGEDEDEEKRDDGNAIASHKKKRKMEQELLIAAYDNLRFPTTRELGRERWIRALTHGKRPALSALLILLLPNLEIFSRQIDSHDSPNILCQAVETEISQRVPSSPPRFLSKLTELSYGCWHPGSHLELSDVAPFFFLPNLRRVYIYSLSVYWNPWSPSPHLQSCNVESLEIHRGDVSTEGWATFFRLMRNMKYFSYSPRHRDYARFRDPDISVLGEQLKIVKDTLESLVLAGFYLNGSDTDLLGSLKDFPRLKRINIQIILLIGGAHVPASKGLWELLPYGIEELLISDKFNYGMKYREDMFDQIAEMVVRKESHFPDLRKIAITRSIKPYLRPLEEVCLAKGVKFCPY